jgi:hypothetical protein
MFSLAVDDPLRAATERVGAIITAAGKPAEEPVKLTRPGRADYPPSNEWGAPWTKDRSDAGVDFGQSGNGAVFNPALSCDASVGLHSGLSSFGQVEEASDSK